MKSNASVHTVWSRPTRVFAAVLAWSGLTAAIVPGCSGSEPSAAGGSAATPGTGAGCPGCECSGNATCDPGLICQSDRCAPFICASSSDCSEAERCYSGGCIPASCGNGALDANEKCDDGNLVNADGCNIKCAIEPSGPLPDGEPYTLPQPNAKVVSYSLCSDSSKTEAFAATTPIYVRVCARGYTGMDELDLHYELSTAQSFLDQSGTQIKLIPAHIEIANGTPNETDPNGDAQLGELAKLLDSYFSAAYPGECDVVAGYTNTLTKNNQSFGGFGWYPWSGPHVALISRSNVDSIPGHTTAHELGHVFGLPHTFEPGDDGCEDTGLDPNCYLQSSGCNALCGAVAPPATNVMSYYFCDVPNKDSFSLCQARRARCFLSNMFSGTTIPPKQNEGDDVLDAISVAKNSDGSLEIFTRGADEALWHARQDAASVGGWTALNSLGGGMKGPPVLVMNADGRLEVFIHGTDDALWHIWQMSPSSAWSAWAPLGGGMRGQPVLGMNANKWLEIFIRGTDNALWHMRQDPASFGGWTSWESLGGALTGDPVVGRHADGRLEVFARVKGGAIHHIWQPQPASGWSGWEPIGTNASGQPVIGVNADGRLEVFVRGTDGALWHSWQGVLTPDKWSTWHPFGGGLIGDPIVVQNTDGRLEIFVRGTDNGLHHKNQIKPSEGWSEWASLGGGMKGPPVPGRNADSYLKVFVHGTDNATWHISQSPGGPGGWAEWSSLGGLSDGQPAVWQNSDGRLEVFTRGLDNSVWHAWQVSPSGGWTKWTPLGGL